MEKAKVFISSIVLTEPHDTKEYIGYVRQALDVIAPGLAQLSFSSPRMVTLDSHTLVMINSVVPPAELARLKRSGARILQCVFRNSDPEAISSSSQDELVVQLLSEEATLTLAEFWLLPSFCQRAKHLMLGWAIAR